MRVIGLQKLVTFGEIRLVNEEFIGIFKQKTAMGHLPPNFPSPLAPKLLVWLKKIEGVQKRYGHPL